MVKSGRGPLAVTRRPRLCRWIGRHGPKGNAAAAGHPDVPEVAQAHTGLGATQVLNLRRQLDRRILERLPPCHDADGHTEVIPGVFHVGPGLQADHLPVRANDLGHERRPAPASEAGETAVTGHRGQVVERVVVTARPRTDAHAALLGDEGVAAPEGKCLPAAPQWRDRTKRHGHRMFDARASGKRAHPVVQDDVIGTVPGRREGVDANGTGARARRSASHRRR